jgi:2,3-bisphosphoglycerate-dependent phosphoglycerate mutase
MNEIGAGELPSQNQQEISQNKAPASPEMKKNPLLESLGIPEKDSGKPIGTLIVCGQGPVQDASTKVKLENLNNAMPGTVSGHEANTWMRLNARAAGELNSERDVGLIITSGKDTGGKYEMNGQKIAPTEAELMGNIIENVYGKNAEIALESEAKNTLFNIINASNIIDGKREVNPNDPNLENVWVLGSHFHGPRLKILSSLFGLDPKHVLSAEDILMKASVIKQEVRAENPTKFDRQAALQKLLKVRLSNEPVAKDMQGRDQDYFQRKGERANELIDRTIDKYLAEKGVSEADAVVKKTEIKKKLFAEEQKDVKTRMKDERRWVRGLAMEADYVLPYSAYLKSDTRLRSFLLKFDSQTLAKYNISREELEKIDPKSEAMKNIRTRIDPNRWSWQVVKEEWKDQEYPDDVKKRFADLGIPQEDIENLSKAEVPALEMEDLRSKIETEKGETKVYFLRHAPTSWNKEGRIQGNVQTDVTPELVLEHLKKSGADQLLKPDLIVVSELGRTEQTANILKEYKGWGELEIVKNAAFNERKWGIMEGKTHEEARLLLLQNSELVQKFPYINDPKEFEQIWNDLNFKAEGGESLGEVGERVKMGLKELQEKYPGKNILLVTHAGVLQTQGLDFQKISPLTVKRNGEEVVVEKV